MQLILKRITHLDFQSSKTLLKATGQKGFGVFDSDFSYPTYFFNSSGFMSTLWKANLVETFHGMSLQYFSLLCLMRQLGKHSKISFDDKVVEIFITTGKHIFKGEGVVAEYAHVVNLVGICP